MKSIIILFILAALAIAVYLRGRKSKRNVICVEEGLCQGCGRCVGACSYQVLTLNQGKDGKTVITIRDPLRCRACGHCVNVCPFGALRLVERS